MNIALILAGGIGSRVGSVLPKQFIEVQGRPILAYTIDKFENHEEVDAILVVCIESYLEEMASLIKYEKFSKVIDVVCGGETFQYSVINGIEGLRAIANASDNILIHYGASPFVDNEIISDAIKVCNMYGNASPASKLIPLSAHSDLPHSTNRVLDRGDVVCLNAPQVLRFDYLCDLYERAKRDDVLSVVDPHTTSLMLAFGERIYYSLDKTTNIKITTMDDVRLFDAWVQCSI